MAKKTFADRIQQKAVNPTLQYLSQPVEAQEPQDEPQTVEELTQERSTSNTPRPRYRAPQARRATAQYAEETKSRRLQVLLTPTLYEAVKDKAAEERRSVNDFINAALWDAIRRR